MPTFNINCHLIYKMKYQKIANLLGDTYDQPSKFRTRNWVEINHDPKVTYTDADIKLKTNL